MRLPARSILALAALGLLACRAPTQAPVPESPEPHLEGTWIPHRAKSLGLSEADALSRDGAMAAALPPEGAWDDTLSAEAAALWVSGCASCHGLKGDPSKTPVTFDPPPRTWGTMGTRMGFTMGGDDMRTGVFETIRNGAPAHEDGQASPMVGWGDRLSNEQIWGLVYHLEGF